MWASRLIYRLAHALRCPNLPNLPVPEFPGDDPASRFALTGGRITQRKLEIVRPLKDYPRFRV